MGYRLDVAPESVDVVRFEALAARPTTWRSTDPSAAGRSFGAALALWRGEPFADVVEPLAFGPERARLDALHQRAHAGWLSARVEAGGAADAIPDLERAVAADPLDEAAAPRPDPGAAPGGPHRRRPPHGHRPAPAADRRDRPRPEQRARPSWRRRLLADDPDLRPAARPAPADPPAGPGAAPTVRPRSASVRDRRRTASSAATASWPSWRRRWASRRVVTIVGAGGAGKTRLALELVDRGGAGRRRWSSSWRRSPRRRTWWPGPPPRSASRPRPAGWRRPSATG